MPLEIHQKEDFSKLAHQLLNSFELVVNGQCFRLAEIEFYFYSQEHPDIFTHCSELQKKNGFWYFHRIGNSYKGGSFKGLDMSIGGNGAIGGILLRSISDENGQVTNGPSLLVDKLIELTNNNSVAELDRSIENKVITDDTSPIFVRKRKWRDKKIYSTARVGLTLKKVSPETNPETFIIAPYRFLNEPAKIKKGRIHLILSLYFDGHSSKQIKEITGSPLKSIDKYISWTEETANWQDFYGRNIGNKELCQIHAIKKTQKNC